MRSAWLYVRIEEKDAPRLEFALPMPLSLVNGLLRLTRPFVPADQAQHLDTAATLVRTLREDPNHQPIVIDVNDPDGDRVEIYIG
jgi:hypothetical protein